MRADKIMQQSIRRDDKNELINDPVINIIAAVIAANEDGYKASILALGALNKLYMKDGGLSLAVLATDISSQQQVSRCWRLSKS